MPRVRPLTMTPHALYTLGYADMICVVPPDAQLSEHSKLLVTDRGKVPGRPGSDGRWSGYDWRGAAIPSIADVDAWHKFGANIGLRAAHFPAVDIDCLDPQIVSIVEQLAAVHLGVAPKRVGRSPKSLLIYRTAAPFGRMRLWIDETHLIEVLGDGQQYVVAGMHPITRVPYAWPNGAVAAHQLPEITRDEAAEFLTHVEQVMDMCGHTCRREGHGGLAVDRAAIDQAALRGDPAKLREALQFIPNDNARFAGRDDYLRMGYAIKAALGEDGFEVFEDWALQWEGNDRFDGNDPETVRADWDRMKPPFEVGANWIFEQASEFGYDWAADEFGTLTQEAPLAVVEPLAATTAPAAVSEPAGDDSDAAANGPVEYSDGAMANRLLKAHGHSIRHCELLGGWLAWDGRVWARGGDKMVRHWASRICVRAGAQALQKITEAKKAEAIATRLSSNAAKNAVASYAADHPSVSVQLTDLDADGWLLNTPAGVVDLRDGTLRRHDPKLLMTRITATGPAGGVPTLWRAFLVDATGGDAALEAYLQRLAGYALTGDKSDHMLAFLWGAGGNGKGTFLNTLADIFGDYAKAAPMEMFVASKSERHPTELADLAGARLVIAQETQEGRRWDEAKVKALTSHDKTKARFMREDFFEFVPTFKLVLAGNHKPEIRNLHDAMRRRFHLVPFDKKPVAPDAQLGEKLKREWPQILQWAIEGCLLWQQIGLRPPPSVVAATNEYFDEEDPIGQWMHERIEADEEIRYVSTQALYEDWREWCGENGEYVRSAKALGRVLAGRGWERAREGGSGARGFRGYRLTRQPGDEFKNV